MSSSSNSDKSSNEYSKSGYSSYGSGYSSYGSGYSSYGSGYSSYGSGYSSYGSGYSSETSSSIDYFEINNKKLVDDELTRVGNLLQKEAFDLNHDRKHPKNLDEAILEDLQAQVKDIVTAISAHNADYFINTQKMNVAKQDGNKKAAKKYKDRSKPKKGHEELKNNEYDAFRRLNIDGKKRKKHHKSFIQLVEDLPLTEDDKAALYDSYYEAMADNYIEKRSREDSKDVYVNLVSETKEIRSHNVLSLAKALEKVDYENIKQPILMVGREAYDAENDELIMFGELKKEVKKTSKKAAKNNIFSADDFEKKVENFTTKQLQSYAKTVLNRKEVFDKKYELGSYRYSDDERDQVWQELDAIGGHIVDVGIARGLIGHDLEGDEALEDLIKNGKERSEVANFSDLGSKDLSRAVWGKVQHSLKKGKIEDEDDLPSREEVEKYWDKHSNDLGEMDGKERRKVGKKLFKELYGKSPADKDQLKEFMDAVEEHVLDGKDFDLTTDKQNAAAMLAVAKRMKKDFSGSKSMSVDDLPSASDVAEYIWSSSAEKYEKKKKRTAVAEEVGEKLLGDKFDKSKLDDFRIALQRHVRGKEDLDLDDFKKKKKEKSKGSSSSMSSSSTTASRSKSGYEALFDKFVRIEKRIPRSLEELDEFADSRSYGESLSYKLKPGKHSDHFHSARKALGFRKEKFRGKIRDIIDDAYENTRDNFMDHYFGKRDHFLGYNVPMLPSSWWIEGQHAIDLPAGVRVASGGDRLVVRGDNKSKPGGHNDTFEWDGTDGRGNNLHATMFNPPRGFTGPAGRS